MKMKTIRNAGANDDNPRVADRRAEPSRTIYCLDLRTHDDAESYLEEIERIAA